MKNKFIHFISIVCLLLLTNCSNTSNVTKPNNETENSNKEDIHVKFPKDMVLIYAGGSGRKPWNKHQLRSYLYRIQDGKVQWLFDGFLFLEIFTTENGKQYSFVVDDNPAGKKQWKTIIERTFAPERGPNALEQLLESLSQPPNPIKPRYPRKVVISIPNPVYGDKNWGTLNGEKLNFTKVSDRVAAAKWYVNQVLKVWKSKNYQHLKLAGFYWVREAIVNKSSIQVIHAMSHYLHNKGFDFYWIPYNGAEHAGDWRKLGFDIAYQQPNYFFDPSTPYSVLTGAINFAQEHNMNFEMEFDARLIANQDYREKYYDYLNAFKKAGVWENKHVAYYEGGGAWLEMFKSTNPKIHHAFEELADILVKRKYNSINN